MERMASVGLMWCLESMSHLSYVQCGFQKNCSTVGQLVHYDCVVDEAFV